jgi:RNA polymerase sigma-70 factor, ECF subfamily
LLRVIISSINNLRLAIGLHYQGNIPWKGASSQMPCDRDAERLVNINIDGLYSYAMVLTHHQADAEDLVHETYVRAMRTLRSLQADSNLKAWLFTILRNVWLDQVRERRFGPQFFEIADCHDIADGIGQPTKEAHDHYLSKMEMTRVQDAIQKLPLECREIIVLREYEELSYREIASVLGSPVGTVMSRLATARTKLRKMLSVAMEPVLLPPGR